ncbi:MAG: c-type cytochrome [Rhodocyclales bacterium]|nr:c-type cytochrome [Rhodocyclales bacterium]
MWSERRRRLLRLATALAIAGAASLAGAAPLADPLAVEQGRRIYEKGILPDGTALTATRFGVPAVVRGGAAACVNCHRRSGYGGTENGIFVPPIAGAVLFEPGPLAGTTHSPGKVSARLWRLRTRSAYDEPRLQRALRDGVDPDGVALRAPMPRYRLDARAVAALAAYLRHLSTGPAPGVENGILHLGTVVAPDVPPQRRDAMLDVLRAYAAERGRRSPRWQLHVWQLVGPPQDWGAQLEAHYRQQPVFALLSGVGSAEWSPVHGFCERNAVPCVLPAVDLPPEREGAYYSFYFSPGVALEARVLAQHLHSGAGERRRLIQVVADDTGRRAAATARETLAGRDLALERIAADDFPAAAQRLAADDAVVLWLTPHRLADLVARMPEPPQAGTLFVSSMLAAPEELALPAAWKAKLRYLSVFDPLAARRARSTLLPWLEEQGVAATDLRLRGDVQAACFFFSRALGAVKAGIPSGVAGPLTRERLSEALEAVLSDVRDDPAPYYRPINLGPGQRIPVRNGLLLRYADPAGDDLVPVAARIAP